MNLKEIEYCDLSLQLLQPFQNIAEAISEPFLGFDSLGMLQLLDPPAYTDLLDFGKMRDNSLGNQAKSLTPSTIRRSLSVHCAVWSWGEVTWPFSWLPQLALHRVTPESLQTSTVVGLTQGLQPPLPPPLMFIQGPGPLQLAGGESCQDGVHPIRGVDSLLAQSESRNPFRCKNLESGTSEICLVLLLWLS